MSPVMHAKNRFAYANATANNLFRRRLDCGNAQLPQNTLTPGLKNS